MFLPLITSVLLAQSVSVSAAAAPRVEQFRYRFDNPSTFESAERVPHFFEQKYDVVPLWFSVEARYRAGGTRAVTNAAVSHLRREGRRPTESLAEHASAGGPSPLGETARGEVREQFRRTLAELPEKQRLAVQWHDVDGFTAEEIGESLGVPSGTVRWYLHQARQTLRKALAPWHGTLEESNDEH